MATKTNLIVLLLFTLCFISAAAMANPDPPADACASTLYPKLCRSFFPSVESPALYPYSHERQFLFERALRISLLVHRRLRNTTHSDTVAVDDCHELFQANVELIKSVVNDLKSLELEYSADTVHGVQTRLSAIVANGRTCRESLPENHDSMVITALSQSQRVYSVALGLVTQALSQRSPSHQRHSGGGHHHHHHSHHHHHDAQSPPAPIRMTQSSTPPPAMVSGGGIRRESPSPAPRMPERMLSPTDMIKSLKKSPGRLHLQGLRGNGIPVGHAVTVSKDRTGDFETIEDAIDSAPDKLKPKDGYFVIYAKKGVYKEYVSISKRKTNILLLGDGINNTIITGNRSNATGWGTSNSATFGVRGDRFMAIDVTFRNTYGTGSMAVAVRNQADQSAFFRCSFEGYQDTLFVHSGNQFYRECDVYGTIDFVFGDAAAVFQKCHIIGRRPALGETVVVSAQSRDQIDESTGISFHNCTVDSAEAGSGPVFLGRPWRPYSRVVFMQSYLGEAVDPRGWMEWDTNQTEHSTVYYGEYQNDGPGAAVEGRVDWPGVTRNLTDSAAESFTVRGLTNGGSWLPDMDIPFDIGMK